MGDENLSLEEFIINCVKTLPSVENEDPETFQDLYLELLSYAASPRVASKLKPHAATMLLNYWRKWVFEDSLRNHTALVSEFDHAVVDHVHYRWQMKAMHNLNDNISYSAAFKYFLHTLAVETVDDIAGRTDLNEWNAFFPYMSDDRKITLASNYAEAFTNLVSKNLGIPMEMPHLQIIEDQGDTNALYVYGELSNGQKAPCILFTPLGLSQGLAGFIFTLQHELIHQVVDTIGRTKLEYKMENPQLYHPYAKDMLLAYAGRKNFEVSSSFYPSLYDNDQEENLCNFVAYSIYFKIGGFTPNRQISRQPLLEI